MKDTKKKKTKGSRPQRRHSKKRLRRMEPVSLLSWPTTSNSTSTCTTSINTHTCNAVTDNRTNINTSISACTNNSTNNSTTNTDTKPKSYTTSTSGSSSAISSYNSFPDTSTTRSIPTSTKITRRSARSRSNNSVRRSTRSKKNNSINNSNNNNQLWVDKYRPTNLEDACVAPKKIKEIREWMKTFYTSRKRHANGKTNIDNASNNSSSNSNSDSDSSSKLLIVVGNAGIGKSTIIRLIAKELNWKINEWNELHSVKTYTNMNMNTNTNMSSNNEWISSSYESQLSSFEQFLSSCALGWNITFVNNDEHDNGDDDDADGNDIGNDCKGSLVLIDEIPNLHSVGNKARFRDIMTNYIQKTQIPTILIFSDVYEGKYKPEDLERIIDPMILSSPQMTTIIQINPVTKIKMKTCISRIIKGEGNRMISKSSMEEIHSQSGGDLRHAIMTLQFQFAGENNNIDRLGIETKEGVDGSTTHRDVRLSAFHTLGKFLYAKRKKDVNVNTTITTRTSNTISYHNQPWNMDHRPPLEFNAERVLEESTIGLNNALCFMGYHSPDFFTDITELDTAFSRFSDGALFMDKSYGSSYNDTSYPYGYATSLISRSVGDANKHPAPFKFRQFHSPKIYEVIRKKRQNEAKIAQLCKKLSCRLDYLSIEATIWSSSSFALEYYPLLKRIIPDDISNLSTDLYSNDNFAIDRDHVQNGNSHDYKSLTTSRATASNTGNHTDDEMIMHEKEIIRQREILAMDDIEDSSSDETYVASSKRNVNGVGTFTQESTKSEIIIIDSD